MSPIFAMALFVSVLFCGLSLDFGSLELTKIRMQTAADAAANAAELQFERGDEAAGIEAGTAAAAQHGFTNNVNRTTVTYLASNLSNAVQGGPYAGQYDGLQIQITRQVSTLFMGLVAKNLVTVVATSVAAVPACQFYLGTKGLATPTVALSSSASTYTTCSAYAGGGISIASGTFWQAWQTYLTGSGAASSITGTLKAGATYTAASRTDPLASVAEPAVGSCNYSNASHGSLTGSAMTITLNPGVYCGSVSGSTVTPGLTLLNGTVTLNPGLYIITGGANWQKVQITGTGVTFFFTQVANTTKYGTVAVANHSTLTLSPPGTGTFGSPVASGALTGMLFFLDRSWVYTAPQDFSINNSTVATSGVWYLPDTGLNLNTGSSSCALECGIVADNLVQTDWENTLSNENFASVAGGNPFNRGSVVVQ